jgi:hypothetical protein
VRDQDQDFAADHPDRLPTRFAVYRSILNAERKWVIENKNRQFETDAMFTPIDTIFVIVPFKAHVPLCTYRPVRVNHIEVDMGNLLGNTLLMRFNAIYAYYYYAAHTGRVQRRMR